MSDVSTPYEAGGRARQKQRTRDSLVAAARLLVSDGATPTVEEVAETAGISRTTAYRLLPQPAIAARRGPPGDRCHDLAPRWRFRRPPRAS